MNENQVTHEVLRVLAHRRDIRLFRNQVGLARHGDRVVRTGLVPGSADFIGWKSVVIGPEMVGLRVARFLSLEIKGTITAIQDNQDNWQSRVYRAGGIALIVRSAGDALEQL